MPAGIPPTLSLHPPEGSSPASPPGGRGLRAARRFGPGDAVALFGGNDGDGVVAIPDAPHQDAVCNGCLLVPSGGPGDDSNSNNNGDNGGASVRACTGCRSVAYCSAACQRADWARAHKGECKAFRRVRAEGRAHALPTPVRALMQVLLRPRLRTAVVAELEGHADVVRTARPGAWRDMELQALAALHYLGREASPAGLAEAIGVLCKLRVNSFDRLDADIGQNGLFLSPALAMVNHSCVPNAYVQFSGRDAILRAYRSIEKDEEVTISYIDCTLHRSHRQGTLQEHYHFVCKCPKCEHDLDVYQACQGYPHLDLNRFALSPGLDALRKPPVKDAFHSSQSLQHTVERIYPTCSTPPTSEGSSVQAAALKEKWQKCEALRDARLYAIEPLPQLLSEAGINMGSRGEFTSALTISCFLALHCHPFKYPMPFHPVRVKDLLMIAKLFSNTAPGPGSISPDSNGPVGARISQTLANIDQVTVVHALLTLAVRLGPHAHSDTWQVYQEAAEMLKDVSSLPGRDQEKSLVLNWAKNPEDFDGKFFFDQAVLKPLGELSALAMDVMDAEVGSGQALVRSS